MREAQPSSAHLDETLQRLLEQAVAVVPGAQAAFLIARDDDSYRYRASVGYPRDSLAEVRWTVRELEPLLRGGAEELPFSPAGRSARGRLFQVIEVDAVPFGCIGVENFDDLEALSTARPVLILLAAQVSLALENARLRDKVDVHRQEFELLASAFSHDLKAPLILIANYAAMLQRRIQAAPPEELMQYLERMRAGVRRAESLAKDLTAYLRLGHSITAKQDVPLAELIEEVRGLLGPLIEAKKAELVVGALPRLTADRGKLEQVFFNLLDNALKYSGEKAPPRISITARGEGSFWRIEVGDRGPGIPLELRPALYRLFSRLPDGQRLAPEGTGVGLAVVRRIVEEHGGTVGVDSEPGEGARFWFTLPRS
jgi:signal transduction histidine kinase